MTHAEPDNASEEPTNEPDRRPSYRYGGNGAIAVVCGACRRRRPSHQADCGCPESFSVGGDEQGAVPDGGIEQSDAPEPGDGIVRHESGVWLVPVTVEQLQAGRRFGAVVVSDGRLPVDGDPLVFVSGGVAVVGSASARDATEARLDALLPPSECDETVDRLATRWGESVSDVDTVVAVRYRHDTFAPVDPDENGLRDALDAVGGGE